MTSRNLLLLFFSALHCTIPTSFADNPTERHGQLKVVGTHLCDAKGEPIQLRGMSTRGLQWFGWPTKLSPASLDVLANDWKSDILRVSMYADEDGYNTDPARFRPMVDTIVDETLKRGMYCLIDWHMLEPGDPMANLEHAKGFFTHMSAAHGNRKFVLYEICNEPSGKKVNWARIKHYAEQVIPVIRKNDPDGVIIVGTPDWSSFGMSGDGGDDILAHPLTGDLAHNLMYAFHFYAGEHKDDYRRQFTRYAEKLPIFVTEWGSQKATGDGPNDFASADAWHALLDRYQISWCNWNYSDDPRSGAVWKRGTMPKGPFTDDRLKEAGVHVKRLICERKNASTQPADSRS